MLGEHGCLWQRDELSADPSNGSYQGGARRCRGQNGSRNLQLPARGMQTRQVLCVDISIHSHSHRSLHTLLSLLSLPLSLSLSLYLPLSLSQIASGVHKAAVPALFVPVLEYERVRDDVTAILRARGPSSIDFINSIAVNTEAGILAANFKVRVEGKERVCTVCENGGKTVS